MTFALWRVVQGVRVVRDQRNAVRFRQLDGIAKRLTSLEKALQERDP
ncbi:hypothetical protein TVNIR_0323 [Thioalkalivibrio nitratireducens DSM 14787]|uniref:Uncharacterized protein n=1 Tax=Thioalkalivibrio nitratireducens (strain DSM 14787 / UNIQEM 213 / ALEN2) TaxID=1255043 RepID=L0DSR0_THIND|nr:hypothetical protein [Thioalkalivibrio nitratireducens]AGA32032.1 hypothetical protein TVNIR_0323 [Thioalkalivibrio nitratireducens DSM 14787]